MFIGRETRKMDFRERQNGVAALEFAVVVPLLLIMILVVVEFGFRFERATVLNNAAFIAARDMTANHDVAKATTAARNAGAPTSATISVSSGPCSTGNNVTVIITSTETSATKAFGETFAVTGTGVARCDG